MWTQWNQTLLLRKHSRQNKEGRRPNLVWQRWSDVKDRKPREQPFQGQSVVSRLDLQGHSDESPAMRLASSIVSWEGVKSELRRREKGDRSSLWLPFSTHPPVTSSCEKGGDSWNGLPSLQAIVCIKVQAGAHVSFSGVISQSKLEKQTVISRTQQI